MKFTRDSYVWYLLASFLFVALFIFPLIEVGSIDLQMVDAIDSDDSKHLVLLRDALNGQTWFLDFPYYGQFLFNLALGGLKVMSWFGPVTDQQNILMQRGAAVFGTLLLSWAVYFFARYFWGNLAAWLSGFLILLHPEVVRWSTRSHPDTLQAASLVMSVYFLCRVANERVLKWLLAAAFFAGTAFGTKYGGTFLVPWLLLFSFLLCDRYRFSPGTAKAYLPSLIAGIVAVLAAAFLIRPENFLFAFSADNQAKVVKLLMLARLAVLAGGVVLLAGVAVGRRFPKWLAFINLFALCLAIFGIGFALVSPYSLYKLQFTAGIYSMSRMLKTGQGFMYPLRLDFIPKVIGPAVFLFFIAAAGISAKRKYHKEERWLDSNTVMFGYVFLFLAYFAFIIKWHQNRALIVVLPFVLMGAASFIAKINKQAWMFAGLLILATIPRFTDARKEILAAEKDPAIEVGYWLRENFPSDAKLLYGEFVYVPPTFTKATKAPLGGVEFLANSPEVVVMSKTKIELFTQPEKAERWFLGKDHYLGLYAFYKGLDDGSLGYRLNKDFGGTKVYVRSDSPLANALAE